MKTLFGVFLGDNETKAESSTVKHGWDADTQAVENEKTKVVIALCALYFNQDHSNQVVVEAATWACNASNIHWNAAIKDRIRKATEPLIWLLGQPEDNDLTWLESYVHCVRLVFLKYVCDKELDDNNISILLKLTSDPKAQRAMLTALADIFSIQETPLLTDDHLSFLEPLMHILNMDSELFERLLGHEILDSSQERQSESILTRMSDLLPFLVRYVQDALGSPTFQSDSRLHYATLTLWELSFGGGCESTKLQISSQKEAMASLVQALSKHGDHILQQNAAGVLLNPALGDDSIKLQIISEDGALDSLLKWLVAALSNHQNPRLQAIAASALSSLANGEERIKLQILHEAGALQGLVGSLSNEDNPKLQEVAAFAIQNFAAGGHSIKFLASLAKSLSKVENPQLQKNAPWALHDLAIGEEKVKRRILDEDGVLQGLVGALLNKHNLELQLPAALPHLALVQDESTKQIIVEKDGALASLVRALSNEDNPKMQEAAAFAIQSIATGGDSIKFQMVSEENMLTSVFVGVAFSIFS
ncbi:unnamed protein product [Calypogeia fissa]